MFDANDVSSFDIPNARPDPVEESDLADDERAILAGEEPVYGPEGEPVEELGTEPDAEPCGDSVVVANPEPEKALPKKKRPKRESGQTLRDEMRTLAGKRQAKRLKWYEDVREGTIKPSPAQMEAAKRLDDLALDKTPTAAPLASARARILIGHVGGIRPNSDIQRPETPIMEASGG